MKKIRMNKKLDKNSLVQIGKTIAVVSFVFCSILGVVFLVLGIQMVMCSMSKTKVSAMIHAKTVVENVKCTEPTKTMVCLSLVYSYGSKDYLTKKTVEDNPQFNLGKVLTLYVNKKNPQESSMESDCSWVTIVFGILFVVLAIVLFWLGIYKINFNMQDPSVAQTTGRHHLHSWL
jgi:hypothetical protein